MEYQIIVSDKASNTLLKHIALQQEHQRLLPRNKYRKYVVSKKYVVLYQIKDKTVYVDYIIDTRQDYTWLL